MPRKRTGYDAACYYDGKLLGRCTKADSDAYTLLMNACGGGGAPVPRLPCPAGICLFFPGTESHLRKGSAHAGRPEPDGRNVPCAEKLPVGRGAEL